MAIWLRAHSDFTLIGRYFDSQALALFFSWAGAAYDLTIPLWLLWRRTRPFAWLAVIVFHAMTGLLFPIGMFPWLMIAAALIFFNGAELRALSARLRRQPVQVEAAKPGRLAKPLPVLGKLTLILFFVVQILLPLRHHLYPGDVNWTMEGYRFAWRVMLDEKAGFATFRVVDNTLGTTQIVYAHQHLTEQQARHMAYQPDMLWQFAQYLGRQHPWHGVHDIAVYEDALVTHNSRPARQLIDPNVNLLAVPRQLAAADWILRD